MLAIFSGVFALLGRSLRIDARGWSAHLTRLGLMASVYFALCFALATENMFGAPGLRFFYGMAYLETAFMTLLGIGYFSTAITEEKEEDTLGLMLMAGISPLGILAGKTGGRLWQAVLLLAVQYPFMLLAVTMGGITAAQIWATTIALAAYAIFLAGFGLLCSTVAPRSRTASGLMVVGLILYFVVPGLGKWFTLRYAGWLAAGGAEWNISAFWLELLNRVGDVCIFLRMGEILTTSFAESPFSLQVTSNALAGLICAGLSWLLFGIAARRPSAEASSRGFVARRRAFFRFTADRPQSNPFVWKDFHFVSGGIGMILVRSIYYSLIATVVLTVQYLKDFPEDEWIETTLILMSFSVAVDAGIVLARSIHDEIRNQTLSTLLMLPRSPNGIVYCKYAGALLGWLPGPIIELAFTLMTEKGRSDLASICKNETGGYLLFLLFALIPHFAALAATYLRWGAVPFAIGLTIAVYFAIIGGLVLFAPNDPADTIFLNCTAFVLICVCIGCHIGTLLRIQTLATK